MEGYVNDSTVIKDKIYDVFKDTITCPLCSNILINPLMCMKCQNVFCKRCIDNRPNKDEKCPKNCENPNYQKSIVKNEILSKLKFKCIGCGNEIMYDNCEKHHSSCCPNKSINFEQNPRKNTKLKKITKEEIKKLSDNGKDILNANDDIKNQPDKNKK